MPDGRRNPDPWNVDDDITALRLQTMQDLAEAAQVVPGSPNVRMYKAVQGGTAIAVDATPQIPDRAVLAQISGPAASPYNFGGMYDGAIMAVATNASFTSSNQSAGLNLVPVFKNDESSGNTTKCLVINLDEVGLTTHPTADNAYVIGVIHGPTTSEDTPRPVIYVGGGAAKKAVDDEDPDTITLGSQDEGSEAADTSDDWVPGDKGLILYAMTREGYYPAGDKKLYGYIREVKIDSKGRIQSVGGTETRIEIDPPGPCP